MYTILVILASLALLYFVSYPYNLLRNLRNARKSGCSYLIVPLDPQTFVWMVASVPLRPWLKANLPTWIYNRISMTIYGFEYSEKDRMQTHSANPKALGDETYVLVHPGSFEVNTRDPELAYEILKRPRDFMQVEIVNLFVAKFGHNVLSSNGDSWSRQRKIVASAINEKISRTVFNESVTQTQGLLEETLGGKSAADTTKIFDAMKKITINVLSGAGMGTSVPWDDDRNEKPSPGFKMTYIEACRVVIKAMVGPIILPLWFLDNYPSFLPGHTFLRDVGHAIREFPVHTKDLLDQERVRAKSGDTEARNNIMSQLLEASEGKDVKKDGKQALSETEMIGNLFVFTAAGFDTTANTLTYAIMLLARYPQWQDWMFEEIDSIMPKDDTAELDYTTIFPKATRVLAVMLETLRFFPPLVHITKGTRLPQTVTTSTRSYWFPANSTVYVNTVGLHMNPDVYRNINLAPGEQPSDRDEEIFRPTRWLNPPGDAHAIFTPPKGCFVPWSLGPRICPGQKMAQVEFTSIFLTLFRNHRIAGVPVKQGSEGKLETPAQMNERYERLMNDSSPIMTLQMSGIYDIPADSDKGVPINVSRRK